MNPMRFRVEIRPATRPGAIKAFADVECEVQEGMLRLLGFSIVQTEGKPPFVGFPSKPGNNAGKYFPVVEAEGSLRKSICEAVLSAYDGWEAQQ